MTAPIIDSSLIEKINCSIEIQDRPTIGDTGSGSISELPPWNVCARFNFITRFQNINMDENTPPSGYRHLSDVEVMKCLTFDKDGWTQQAIADELNCSQSTVNRILKEYDYKTFTQRRQHPDPAHKTIKKDDKHLIIIIKRHYDLLFCDIINLSDLSIFAKTVACRCKEVELVNCYA